MSRGHIARVKRARRPTNVPYITHPDERATESKKRDHFKCCALVKFRMIGGCFTSAKQNMDLEHDVSANSNNQVKFEQLTVTNFNAHVKVDESASPNNNNSLREDSTSFENEPDVESESADARYVSGRCTSVGNYSAAPDLDPTRTFARSEILELRDSDGGNENENVVQNIPDDDASQMSEICESISQTDHDATTSSPDSHPTSIAESTGAVCDTGSDYQRSSSESNNEKNIRIVRANDCGNSEFVGHHAEEPERGLAERKAPAGIMLSLSLKSHFASLNFSEHSFRSHE